jgi:hypothetical protein
MRAVNHTATVLALVLLLVGCSKTTSSSGPSSAPPTPTNTDINHNGTPDSSSADGDWPGRMIVRYENATSPEAIRGRDLLQQQHLLEDLAEGTNKSLKLPYNIPLIGRQCDEANAYWSRTDKDMTICYEDIADGLDIYTRAGDADPLTSAVNSEIATFYHETGHMVVDLYELPATGREEDVADQLAAYILLTPGPDGRLDPGSVQAVKDFARAFEAYSQRRGAIDQGTFADVHSPDETRMYNLECWVYGADTDGNADLVTDGLLPEDRADGCADEYAQLSAAWDTLLGPYLK